MCNLFSKRRGMSNTTAWRQQQRLRQVVSTHNARVEVHDPYQEPDGSWSIPVVGPDSKTFYIYSKKQANALHLDVMLGWGWLRRKRD